jgi:hypothetical protein
MRTESSFCVTVRLQKKGIMTNSLLKTELMQISGISSPVTLVVTDTLSIFIPEQFSQLIFSDSIVGHIKQQLDDLHFIQN